MEKTAKGRSYARAHNDTETIRTPFIQQCIAAVLILMLLAGLRAVPAPEVQEALATVNGYLGYQMPLKRVYYYMDQALMKGKGAVVALAGRFGWELPWKADEPMEEAETFEAVPVFAINEGLAGLPLESVEMTEEPISFQIPLSGPVTSAYGERIHPITGKASFHYGVDIGGALDSAVCSVEKGTVSTVGYDDINGNFVVLSHREGFETRYAHLASVIVEEGQELEKGTPLGIMGNTGLTVGNGHLHFEVQKDGQSIDPASILSFM